MSKKKRKKEKQFRAEEFQAALMQAMNGQKRGVMSGLAGMLPRGSTEQFLLGAALGAGAAYLMSDEKLRGKLIKAGARLYASLMGGYAELKEQMADLQAEVEAERQGAL